jgi:chorismate mutase-like protein
MPKPNPKLRSKSAAVPAQTPSHKAPLEHLREQIDRLDQQLVDLLAQRRRVVAQVTAVKKQHELPTFHPAREENLISARRAQASQAGLDPLASRPCAKAPSSSRSSSTGSDAAASEPREVVGRSICD